MGRGMGGKAQTALWLGTSHDRKGTGLYLFLVSHEQAVRLSIW